MEDKRMPKKGVRIIITGVPRRVIDIEAMVQIIIALGRELEERGQDKSGPVPSRTEAVGP
jgi:hypothetical protein